MSSPSVLIIFFNQSVKSVDRFCISVPDLAQNVNITSWAALSIALNFQRG